MTATQALKHVQSQRPCAHPNPGFWEQLAVYERRLSLSGNESEVQPALGDLYTTEWAVRSVARFQTVSHVLEISGPELFPELASSEVDVRRIVELALDYICGRGCIRADLDWLSALSRKLVELGHDPQAEVAYHLSDESSRFAEGWSTDLSDGMKDKLIRSTEAGCSADAAKGAELQADVT
jgi:hypothetical protein